MPIFPLMIIYYMLIFAGTNSILIKKTSEINEDTPIVFIYDASGSMWGEMEGSTKVEIARNVLSRTIDHLGENQGIALVAYGHRRKGDCEDVEVMTDINNTSKGIIKDHLQAIEPLGKTPLAYSAGKVIDQLKISGQKATIILITDGIESCGGDLCAVIQKAREAGIDFKMHIVGFGLKDENLDQLICAAQAGGGKYFDAKDAGSLTTVLQEATSETFDEGTPNLGIFSTKNDLPIDAWVKVFEQETKKEIGGVRTYQDTGFMSLPMGIYDIEVQPLECSDVTAQIISGVRITEAMTYKIISFDSGKIGVNALMNGEGWDATVNITLANESKSVAGGRTYGEEVLYDISPGTYDIKLTALKINGSATVKVVKNVIVKPGETTEVMHEFETGTAKIGALGTNGLMDATINIVDVHTNRSVGGSRTYTSESSNPKVFLVNPGTYKVTLVGVGEFKGEKRSFEMTIAKGETFEKMVQY